MPSNRQGFAAQRGYRGGRGPAEAGGRLCVPNIRFSMDAENRRG